MLYFWVSWNMINMLYSTAELMANPVLSFQILLGWCCSGAQWLVLGGGEHSSGEDSRSDQSHFNEWIQVWQAGSRLSCSTTHWSTRAGMGDQVKKKHYVSLLQLIWIASKLSLQQEKEINSISIAAVCMCQLQTFVWVGLWHLYMVCFVSFLLSCIHFKYILIIKKKK